ncbi:hypothetical protein INR49_020162 [Caranx melampygus]|nr:hypothetical protein INR49_020162 [Caranx melampygus]
MGLDLPLLGYTGPLGNNLSEVQKVLQIVDNTVCRQKMDGNPEEISKLRAYMKELGAQMEEQKLVQTIGHSSPTKSIIDYTLEKVNEAKSLIDDSKKQVDIKKEKPAHLIDLGGEEKSHDGQSQFLQFSCQYCKETFPGPIPLHQHERYLCKMNEEIKAVLQPEISPTGRRGTTASELSGTDQAPSPINPFKDHMSVLKTYFAMNTDPNSEELLKISVAVGLPQDFVKEWFAQWKSKTQLGGRKKSPPPDLKHSLSRSPMSLTGIDSHVGFTNEDTHGDIPLDLSLPKHMAQRLITVGEKRPRPNGFITEHKAEAQGREQGCVALDLINIKKEVLVSDVGGNSLHHLEKSTSPIFGINPFAGAPVYTSLPPHGTFPPPTFMSPAQATIPGLRPYTGIDPMSFLPHMAYTYATGEATFAEMQQRRKYQRKPGFQGELLDGTADYLSGLDDLTDSDSLLSRKKIRRLKVLTMPAMVDVTGVPGKRPHQCQICKKAFKHKHT